MVVLALVLLGAGALVWVRPSGTSSGDSFDANGKLLEVGGWSHWNFAKAVPCGS